MVADQASNPVSLDPETAFLVPTMLLLDARRLYMWVSYK